MTNPVPELLNRWQRNRQALAELERAEHPDVTDRHGRVWTWVSGDVYVHDGLLAWPLHMVTDDRAGLPAPGLAEDNPNYAGLCAICRHAPREAHPLFGRRSDLGNLPLLQHREYSSTRLKREPPA